MHLIGILNAPSQVHLFDIWRSDLWGVSGRWRETYIRFGSHKLLKGTYMLNIGILKQLENGRWNLEGHTSLSHFSSSWRLLSSSRPLFE